MKGSILCSFIFMQSVISVPKLLSSSLRKRMTMLLLVVFSICSIRTTLLCRCIRSSPKIMRFSRSVSSIVRPVIFSLTSIMLLISARTLLRKVSNMDTNCYGYSFRIHYGGREFVISTTSSISFIDALTSIGDFVSDCVDLRKITIDLDNSDFERK